MLYLRLRYTFFIIIGFTMLFDVFWSRVFSNHLFGPVQHSAPLTLCCLFSSTILFLAYIIFLLIVLTHFKGLFFSNSPSSFARYIYIKPTVCLLYHLLSPIIIYLILTFGSFSNLLLILHISLPCHYSL